MPADTPAKGRRILVIGPGPWRIADNGAVVEAMAALMRAVRPDRRDTRIVVTSNPASVWSDPSLAYRTYLEPLDMDALRAIVLAERPAEVVAAFACIDAEALVRALESEGVLAAVGAVVGTQKSAGFLAQSDLPEGATKPPVDAPVTLVLGSGPARLGGGADLLSTGHDAVSAAIEAGHSPVQMDISPSAACIEELVELQKATRATGALVQFGGERALELAAELGARGLHVFGTPHEAVKRARAHARAATGDPNDAARAAASAHDDPIAVSVDGVTDGKRVVIAGVTEHLEPPFVHPGDAAAIFPPFTLNPEIVARVEDRVRALVLELGIVGLFGVRVAIHGEEIVILDIEPRAGLTTAFVSRATGLPLVAIATKVMLGKSLDELGITERPLPRHVAARERVFPPADIAEAPVLGAQMRSTGEAIGIDDTPARAYAKALRGVGISLRAPGVGAIGARASRSVLFCVSERDRASAVELARRFRALGFDIVATGDTASAISKARVSVSVTERANEHGALDPLVDGITGGQVDFAIVTARGDGEIAQTRPIRSACIAARIPCFTTMRLARLGCAALEEDPAPRIRALQDWYAADT